MTDITPNEENIIVEISIDALQENTVLKALRQEIDDVDQALLHMIKKRSEIAKHIGNIKKENNAPALQPTRRQEVLQDRIHEGRDMGLSQELVEEVWEILHKHSILQQG